MNVHELKQLINEVIKEVEFDYSEDEEIKKIQNIANLSKVAWRQTNPSVMKKYLELISNIAEDLIEMHKNSNMRQEGYGIGPGDPKAAGNWTVHYPSEKDWKKNKKSLDKVYEQEKSE